ncbi:MAG TPA: hypothetical protein VGB75_17200 [Jatrophihabitans sp.]|jgi:hypothetical protein|uniref:hypothetical protein n=1 Tax=Jatrophihabitans sp. TaxID=1932789 RepID=UPI002F05EF97
MSSTIPEVNKINDRAPHTDHERNPAPASKFDRRLFLKGAAGIAAAGGVSMMAPSAALAAAKPQAAPRSRAAATGTAPLPKALRSQAALVEAGDSTTAFSAALPIVQRGTTYQMAQEVRWLDADHFAVGRWDGSMSIFEFQTAPYQGPLINEAVSSPAMQGLRMITALSGAAIATSNDSSSLALWRAGDGDWANLTLRGTYNYDPALGSASSGAWVAESRLGRLVVGHASGHLSIWRYDPVSGTLTFERSVDVTNPNPVNPWNDHTVEDVVVADAAKGIVAAGSEDGYVTMMRASTGRILSQTLFNPQAQRGINALSVVDDRLLVSNCSVGPSDYNTWYYSINADWSITLLDKANLLIDTSRSQTFNFDIVWGTYSGGRCWFASTEEGALWMGTVTQSSLQPIGYQRVTAPLGSALAFQGGELAMVAYDLYQFTTA